MIPVLLIIHVFVTLALIGVVLIQRSEGGGLGIGSTQGMGSFMGGRGTANLLTRATAILAAMFMVLSLALALLNRGTVNSGRSSILDRAPISEPVGGTSVPTGSDTGKSGEAPATQTPSNAAPSNSAPSNALPGVPAAKPSGPTVPTN